MVEVKELRVLSGEGRVRADSCRAAAPVRLTFKSLEALRVKRGVNMGTVELKSSEGTVSGYLAIPRKGNGPGVLVLHAWWGLNDFFKSLCDRLATAGFVAFAPDLHHGAIASTRDGAEKLLSKLDQKAAGGDVVRGVRGLQNHPAVRGKRVGLVGFSLGAFIGLWAAQELPKDLAAVVLFYGTREGNYERGFAETEAAFLGHFAETDEFESAASVQDLEKLLRANRKDVTFHTYPGTMHWFFEEDRSDAYNARAAKLAWERTIQFLRTHVSGKGVDG
jgi:carboxymethylenebutenolidase